MKWKHLYNQLGLSSQITSASYSLKMAYKKHLFPFEEHQRTSEKTTKTTAASTDSRASPVIKADDQQPMDEECGSVPNNKSSNVDQDSDQCTRTANHTDDGNTVPPPEVAEGDTPMDTTTNTSDNNTNTTNRYDFLYMVEWGINLIM